MALVSLESIGARTSAARSTSASAPRTDRLALRRDRRHPSASLPDRPRRRLDRRGRAGPDRAPALRGRQRRRRPARDRSCRTPPRSRCWWTRDGSSASVSGAFAALLGHDPELVVGEPADRLGSDRSRSASRRRDRGRTAGRDSISTFEATLHHRDGVRSVPLEFYVVNLLDDPVVEGLVVTAYDISPLREAQDSFEFLATHDRAHQLANRSLLSSASRPRSTRAPERGPLTVFFLDLDRFKPVNDLLVTRPGPLLRRSAPAWTVAVAATTPGRAPRRRRVRHRGRGVEPPATAQAIAGAHRVGPGRAVPLGAGTAQVTRASASPGRSTTRPRTRSSRRGRRDVPGQGGAPRRDPTPALPVTERRRWPRRSRRADRRPDRGPYQPVVELIDRPSWASRRWCAGSARASDSCMPGDFISVAEEAGLELDSARCVLSSVPRSCVSGRRGGRRAAFASRSTSPSRSSRHPSSRTCVAGAARRHGLAPATGSASRSPSRRARAARRRTGPPIAACRAARRSVSRLAIDDFGTGYSSLTHLREFRPTS